MGVNELLERIADLDRSPSDEPEVPPPELVGLIVRWGRSLHQWKRNTLADFAGVSLSTVERVERGEKVSEECLDRIAIALGYKRGDFTTPRRRHSTEEATAELIELYGSMEVVDVRPLRTQSQVRETAKCEAFLVHRPGVEEGYDDDIGLLAE